MNNLLENLNPEQLKAVMHKDGPVLIVAGAGTGKTTVIAQRVAYLIEQGKAKSDEVLALTFTEKAAAEMEERVDRLLPMGYLDLWISTFHSFGERILKAHGLTIGLSGDFKLLNEFEQWALIQKNLDKFNLDYYRPLGSPTKFIHALVKHFSRLKDEDIGPADYLAYAEELKQNLDAMLSGGKKKNPKSQITKSKQIINPKSKIINSDINPDNGDNIEIAEQEVFRIGEIANAYHVYQQLLLDNNSLDFGDLINYTLKLFKTRPALRQQYQQQFKYILVDEFQDTNWAQYELVKLLTGDKGNLMVVGDDDQSIYKFRGASVSNILQFKKDYPAAQEIFLVNNYRSTQNILDLSYGFIQLNNPNRLEWQIAQSPKSKVPSLDKRSGAGKNPNLSKKLIADNKETGVIEVIKGKDLDEEIRLVIEKIAELKIADKNCSWNDFGILVRANDSAKEICNLLDQAGLPYQFLASRGLYAKPLIMDIIAYFKLLDNYHENPALYRVLNLPVFNFSYQELVNFNYWAQKKAWSLFEVLKSAAALNIGAELQNKVNNFLQLIEKHTALVREKSVAEIFLAFLTDSGYLKYLIGRNEAAGREAAGLLNQFIKRIRAFEASSDDKSVKQFLAELNLEIISGEQGALAFDPEAGPETIKIMTVHGAKGLEYKYVFVMNLVDKRFPAVERGELIAVPDKLVKEVLPEGDIHLEEERRLFYVAMTRAKQGIFFSWAPDYGGARGKKPSRFLNEINLMPIAEKEDKIRNPKSPASTSEAGRAEIPRFAKASARRANPKQFQNSKSRIFEKDDSRQFVLPAYISYSQLAAFNNCPYQYRFAHILKIPVRGKMVFSFGKTMHLALQKLFSLVNEKKGLGQGDLFGNATVETRHGASPLTAPKISVEELKEIFEQSWLDDWYESKKQKAEYKKLGQAILEDFYNQHKDNWPAAMFLEKGFSFKVKNNGQFYTVRGVIDRIDALGSGIKIVDYKTGKPKDKLTFEEKEQLLIYQIAMQDLFSQPVAALAFYYLENNSEMEFTATPEELAKIKNKIIETIEAINQGEFPPKPSLLCGYCDFRDICEFRKL